MLARPAPDPVGPGQESVWDYPRPPALERPDQHVVVRFAGHVVAETHRPWRVLETSHPPVYYVPRSDVDTSVLHRVDRVTVCEFKGAARYADLVVGDRRAASACWWYPRPTLRFAPLADAVAFYPHLVDEAVVDGEPVRAVQGDFYGGWVTSQVVGPFKGGPGTAGW
jgi:uncharacterized protein (DUF427 family)